MPRGLCRESDGDSSGPGEGRGDGLCNEGVDIMATSEGRMRTRQLDLAFLIMISELDEVCSKVPMHQAEPNV
jgi:hypothetical protein